LGLLGEKYLEIIPGTPGKPLVKNNEILVGKDPVSMEKVTENLANLSEDVRVIVERLRKGEGTIGKLLAEDAVYNDVKAITGNFREFSEDVKRHPWKLLNKPRSEED
jgi:phospholipid/cholesterol/gamma-HCH transport system substrate-binding protein